MSSTHRDRGEPRGPTPPTPPYIRVRIRRFGELSSQPPLYEATGGRGLVAHIVAVASVPASPRHWASPSGLGAQARQYRVLPHGHHEMRVPTPHVHRSGLRSAEASLLCPLLTSAARSRAFRPAQSGVPDTPQTSRGKSDRLHRTPAGFTTPVLDDRGLRDHLLARPTG